MSKLSDQTIKEEIARRSISFAEAEMGGALAMPPPCIQSHQQRKDTPQIEAIEDLVDFLTDSAAGHAFEAEYPGVAEPKPSKSKPPTPPSPIYTMRDRAKQKMARVDNYASSIDAPTETHAEKLIGARKAAIRHEMGIE
jgi:hypothetical protein